MAGIEKVLGEDRMLWENYTSQRRALTLRAGREAIRCWLAIQEFADRVDFLCGEMVATLNNPMNKLTLECALRAHGLKDTDVEHWASLCENWECRLSQAREVRDKEAAK